MTLALWVSNFLLNVFIKLSKYVFFILQLIEILNKKWEACGRVEERHVGKVVLSVLVETMARCKITDLSNFLWVTRSPVFFFSGFFCFYDKDFFFWFVGKWQTHELWDSHSQANILQKALALYFLLFLFIYFI